MDEKAMFEDAQVGDRVWSLRFGWGVILETNYVPEYPIRATFALGSQNFTLSGKSYVLDKKPSLFWDEIKFDIPPRPKRKVKKKVEFWINFYSNNSKGGPHDGEDIADRCAGPNRIGPAVRFIHILEVDE